MPIWKKGAFRPGATIARTNNNRYVSALPVTPVVDTVLIKLRNAKRPRALERAVSSVDTNGIERVRGCLGSFDVRYNAAGILRLQGSLPKLLYGSNLNVLSRAEVEQAVRVLVGALDVDPHAARIFRLDLAATMEMPRPVANYLPLLQSAPYMKRGAYQGESVFFYNGLRKLSFYDKAEEAGAGGHLLRVELRYKRRLKDQVGWPVVLADLYALDMFPVFVDAWHRAYASVRKVGQPVLVPTSSVRELARQMQACGVMACGGEAALLAIIGTWKVDRKTKHRLCRWVRDTMGAAPTGDGALIEELDAAAKQAVRAALNGGLL